MSGRDAVRGFEYQFLRTLEYGLAAWDAHAVDFEAIEVDSSSTGTDSGVDSDIVDFAIRERGSYATVAQVKGGIAGSALNVSDVLRIMHRLLTQDAKEYLLLTNRQKTPTVSTFLAIMDRHRSEVEPIETIRAEVLSTLDRSPRTAELIASADSEWWDRLRRARVVFDARSTEEVYGEINERVRGLRRNHDPDNVGWQAAGVISMCLVTEMLRRAAGHAGQELTGQEIAHQLALDPAIARSILQTRDWAVHVPAPPRGGDIARPSIIDEIAKTLTTPLRESSAVQTHVLSGLSGIGKTTIAVAWADENAGAYSTIFWIDASSEAKTHLSFRSVYTWFGEADSELDADLLRTGVFTILASTGLPWLMVFDNAVDLEHVRAWLPPRGRGHVLVTTTDPQRIAGGSVSTSSIGPMSFDESVQLLAARMLGRPPRSDAESDKLRQLATSLERWPLAMELASAYLVNCCDGFHGIDAYEQLLLRSLGDKKSVPPGYPTTLIGAINLAWTNLSDSTDMVDLIAAGALRLASLMAARRIPIHTLLPTLPKFLAGKGNETGIPLFSSDEIPIGEVLRAMKSNSLVADDTPIQFEPDQSKPIAPTDPGYAIRMNEIVQAILRRSVIDDDLIEHGLTQLSGVLVQWLFSIGKWGRADLYDPVIYHAAAICEHVIEESVENPFTALILGNTGSALVSSGHYELAVDYFTVELSIIKEAPGAELLQVQTSAGLVSALIALADSPRETGDAVLEQIEYCTGRLAAAVARDRKEASVVIHGLLDALENLFADGFRRRRVSALKAAIRDMLPATPEGPKDRESCLMEVSLLLGANQKIEALELIDSVLAGLAPSDPCIPQLVVLAADCCIATGDWSRAAEYLSVFSLFAEANTVRQTDVGLLVRTVGSACIQEEQLGVLQAHELADEVVTAVASARQHGVALKSADNALMSAILAARACKALDIPTARSILESLGLSNVPSAGRYLLVHLLHRVMMRWIDTHADGIDSLGTAVPLAAFPRTRLADLGISTISGVYVNRAPLDTAQPKELPAIHLAIALWVQNQKLLELNCREMTAELYYAMETVGLKPELVRIEFGIMNQLFDVTDNVEKPLLFEDKDCDGHFVLWFAGLRLMIDPGVMHHKFLDHSNDRESAPDPWSYGPVIRSLFRLPSAVEVIIRRPELTLRYRNARPVVADELLRQLTPLQRASALVGGLNTATHGTVRMASADRSSVEAIRKECPEISRLWSDLTLPSEEAEDPSSVAECPEFAGEDGPVQPPAGHPRRWVDRSRRWFQRW